MDKPLTDSEIKIILEKDRNEVETLSFDLFQKIFHIISKEIYKNRQNLIVEYLFHAPLSLTTASVFVINENLGIDKTSLLNVFYKKVSMRLNEINEDDLSKEH